MIERSFTRRINESSYWMGGLYLLFFICVTPSSLLAQIKDADSTCTLKAKHLSVENDKFCIEGIKLQSKKGDLLQGAMLQSFHEKLEAKEIELAICGTLPDATLSFYSIKIWRNPGSYRLHLKWPLFRFNGITIFALPYLNLPLKERMGGLLLPKLSYSSRDGFRLEQGVYLPLGDIDTVMIAGYIANRGVFGSLEVKALKENLGLDVNLSALDDQGRFRGHIRGNAFFKTSLLMFGMRSNLISDANLWRDISRSVYDILAPYQKSSVWINLSSDLLISLLRFSYFQPTLSGHHNEFFNSRADFWLNEFSLSYLSFASQWGAEHWSSKSDSETLALGSAFWLYPSLKFSYPLAFVRFNSSLNYLLEGFYQEEELSANDLFYYSWSMHLPLFRYYYKGRFIHHIEPDISGHHFLNESGLYSFLSGGIETRLSRKRHAQPVANLALRYLYDSKLKTSYIRAKSRWQRGLASLLGDALIRLDEERAVHLDLRGCLGKALRLCVGYYQQQADPIWQNMYRISGNTSLFRLNTGFYANRWQPIAEYRVFLSELVFRKKAFSLRMQQAFSPEGKYEQGSYQLEYLPKSQCFHLSSFALILNKNHYDIGFRLGFYPQATAKCLRKWIP